MKYLLLITLCISSSKLFAQPFYDNLNKNDLPKEINEYGRLVGKWDCQMLNLVKGSWVEDAAIWEFKYILGGAAVQDFWYNPNEKTGVNYLGTNIRLYNPNSGKWECIWLENQTKSLSSKWESYQDNNGAMILHDGSGKWEIVFYNIQQNSFEWKWDFKQTDGSMKTTMKMKATRITE